MPIIVEKVIIPLLVFLLGAVLVTNPMQFDMVQRITAGGAMLFAAIFFAYTLHKWNDAKSKSAEQVSSPTKPEQAPVSPVEKPPLLDAKLVIDSIEGGKVSYHYTVTNTGSSTANDIRVSEETGKFQAIQLMPAPFSQLQSGAKMDVHRPSAVERDSGGNFGTTLRLRFQNEGSEQKEMGADFKFWIPKDRVQSGEFNSTGADYKAPPLPDHIAALKQQFAQPEGGVSQVLPEKAPDGSFNMVNHQSDKRRLIFDPEKRVVTFETITLSGRHVRLSQPLVHSPSGMHSVIYSWQPKGGLLMVDGQPTVEDLDDSITHPATQTVSATAVRGNSQANSVGRDLAVDKLESQPEKDRLDAKYRWGYTIYGLGEPGTFKTEGKRYHGEFKINWGDVYITRDNLIDQFQVVIPPITLRDQTEIGGATVGGKIRLGEFGGPTMGNVAVSVEILEITEKRIVYLVGFNEDRAIANIIETNKKIALANKGIERFRDLYNQGDFEKIWSEAHADFRTSMSKQDILRLFAENYQTDGKFISSEPVLQGPDPKAPDSRISIVLKSRYEKNERMESFVMVMFGDHSSLWSVGPTQGATK